MTSKPSGGMRLSPEVDVDRRVERLAEDRLVLVPAAHLCAPGAGDVRVRGEPGAPDPDEVQAPPGERLEWDHQAPRCPSAVRRHGSAC